MIFLTAHDETAGVLEGFAAGGLDYTVKPFEKDEVPIRIRTQLERVRLERELDGSKLIQVDLSSIVYVFDREYRAPRCNLCGAVRVVEWPESG